MNMIAHTTKTVNPVTVPPDSFLQQTVQVLIIRIREKERLPAVAPQQDMIHPTGKMNPWFPCHDDRISQLILTCNFGSLTLL